MASGAQIEPPWPRGNLERAAAHAARDDERISHEESIVLVTQSFDMPDSPAPALPLKVGRYPPWHPALVAQGIEHRFPEPCVACSNHAEGAAASRPAARMLSTSMFERLRSALLMWAIIRLRPADVR